MSAERGNGWHPGENRAGSWSDELRDFLRAFSGAFIFAIPLLYTMEMWWIGTYADLWKLLVFLGVAFLICLGLAHSRTAGFKEMADRFASLEQAVDVVAVGVFGSFVVLAVLNRIRLGDPLDSILGQVVIQAVPLSIGAAVANSIFGTRGQKSRQGEAEGHEPDASRALLADLGAALHNFSIDALGINVDIAPGETQQVTINAAPGEYEFYCAVPGHAAAGMVGTLTVQ